MATHSKYIDRNVLHPYVAFTNDPGVTSTVTFADGDYVDFKTSMGRPAKSVILIMQGSVDITIQFNTRLKAYKENDEEPATTVTMPEGVTMMNPFRLVNTTGTREVKFPDWFAVDIMKIVDYTGAVSASNNLTVLGF